MTQEQRRIYLLEKLLFERGEHAEIPDDTAAQRRLLRSLMNVRLPSPVSDEFLAVPDEIRARSIIIDGDIKQVLEKMK